jgi:hypothetical protein
MQNNKNNVNIVICPQHVGYGIGSERELTGVAEPEGIKTFGWSRRRFTSFSSHYFKLLFAIFAICISHS